MSDASASKGRLPADAEELSAFRRWASATWLSALAVPAGIVALDAYGFSLAAMVATFAYVPAEIALAVASLRRYGRMPTRSDGPRALDHIAAASLALLLVLLALAVLAFVVLVVELDDLRIEL